MKLNITGGICNHLRENSIVSEIIICRYLFYYLKTISTYLLQLCVIKNTNAILLRQVKLFSPEVKLFGDRHLLP